MVHILIQEVSFLGAFGIDLTDPFLTAPFGAAYIDLRLLCRLTFQYFFIKNRKKAYLPQVSAKVFSKFLFEPDSYFAPLRLSTTISAQEKDMTNPKQLNRHKVMHGSSSDYGTEVNFFKSVSLLIYVSDALMRAGFITDPPYGFE